MISPMIKEAVREIAREKYGEAPVFMSRSGDDIPGLRVEKGDLVVYVRAAPTPGDAVAIDNNGKVGFERWDPGSGKRIKGVVVTAIRELGR
jgi:hypothetical protein